MLNLETYAVGVLFDREIVTDTAKQIERFGVNTLLGMLTEQYSPANNTAHAITCLVMTEILMKHFRITGGGK